VGAFRAFLERAQNDPERDPERDLRRLDDQEFAEAYAERIMHDLDRGGDSRLGSAAALANWIAIQRHSTVPIETWIPLYTPPRHRIVNNGDYYEPGPHSLLFEVDRAAVTGSEDLYCLSFGPSDCDSFDIDLVRERGKPISRERFDELRGMADEAETAEAADG
jgi:hypothetical protein